MNIYFAPLQGYTEDTYRRLHHKLAGGITEYVSPFVRLEHGGIRSKDARDVRPEFNEGIPFSPQVIAKDETEFRTLVDYLSNLGYRKIDCNMGCPFPLQARHGRGSGLLQHPDNVAAILQAMETYSNVRFSVKMRLGQDDINEGLQLIPLLNAAPLSHITLHPRLGKDQYKGTADLNAFSTFAQAIAHPLIYNGDVRTLSDIRRIETLHPNLEGIMIGRGLLARPSLAAEYHAGTEWEPQRRIALIKQLHEGYYESLSHIIPGEAQLLSKLQTFWDYTDENLVDKKLLKRIRKTGSLRNYLSAIQEIR